MDIKINIPDNKIGYWAIDTFTISKTQAHHFNMGQLFAGHGERSIHPGTYKRLLFGNNTIMSNTPAEIRDHIHFIRKAQQVGGHILINGLGLGMCVFGILQNGVRIEKITVVELNEEVIQLVSPYIKDPCVEIIHFNAFDYKPPKNIRYTCVWHDIWMGMRSDNLVEMGRLHRKYGRRTDWQGSWGKEICQYQKRQEKLYY